MGSLDLSFVAELKHRNVFRVGTAYVVVAWLILQVFDTVQGILSLSDWVGRMTLLMLVIGLPVALIVAWVFELTPEGLKKESDIDRSTSIRPLTGQKLDKLIIIALVLGLAYFSVDKFVLDPARDAELVEATRQSVNEQVAVKQELPKHVNSIAVLPFVNMSDDQKNEYFSDGLAEELLNVLVRIKELRVPSRTSSFIFKGSDKNVTQIGTELQVEHILEGSVRKAGNKIRVTAQLVEVRTDTHLWSETYTRELTDVFAVQDEIANAIVEALKLSLSLGDQQKIAFHSTSDAEAYTKYPQGRYLWNQRTVPSLHASIKLFHLAVELDPEFDQAWAALADTYAVLPEYDFGSSNTYIPLARQAASRALSINPDSARALNVSAIIKAQYEFDWSGAVADYLRAIELEPGYASTHQWYGDTLMSLGRTEEALEQLRIAAILDPFSVVIRHTPGYFLLYTNRLDEAENVYLSVLELDPQFRWTLQNLDILYTIRGEYDKARERAVQLAQVEGFDPAPDLARIDAVENPSLRPRALELLNQRQDIAEGVWGKAMQYALMDEWDSALDSLEKGFAADSPWKIHMNWVFVFNPLHDNPRYQAMLRKMNQLP
jgi:adenylate cyclase